MGRLFQRKFLVTGSVFLLLLSVTNSAAQSKDKRSNFPDNNLNEAVYAVKAHDILKSSDHSAPLNIPNDFNKLLEALTRAFSRE